MEVRLAPEVEHIPAHDMTLPVLASTDPAGFWDWWRVAPREARRALVAASAGWMLDSFDVMLYAGARLVVSDLRMTKSTAGLLGSVTCCVVTAGGISLASSPIATAACALIGSILLC